MILDLLVSDIVDESMIRSPNRVFIFGLNNDALIIKRELQKLGIVSFGYIDNDPKKIGKKIEGTECFDPKKMEWGEGNAVVILTAFARHESQKRQLEELGQPPDWILFDQEHRVTINRNKRLVAYARRIGLNCLLDDENKGHYNLVKDRKAAFIGDVNGASFDGASYRDWRKSRLRKLFSFLRSEGFSLQDKRVVEFASAHGHIARHLSMKAASVIACEGNPLNFSTLNDRLSKRGNIKAMLLDNDTDWSFQFTGSRFDLSIHWGLLYHLYNWEQDLRLTCQSSKLVCLESEVFDSNSNHTSSERFETGLDQSLNGRARIPEEKVIERIFHEENMTFHRFDDCDLNVELKWGLMKYDWVSGEKNEGDQGKTQFFKRRFWIATSSDDTN